MYRQFVALSGLAMILILINHSSNFVLTVPPMLGNDTVSGWQQDVLIVFQIFGIIAVPIYMVISGSFLVYAFQGVSQGKNVKSFAKFIWSSLERILRPYLIWSLCFYIVAYFLYNMRFSLLDDLKNLLVGYPYHFVPLLIFYYLISPLLIWFAKRYPIIMLLVIFLYQMFLLNLLAPGFLGFVFPSWVGKFRPPVISGTLADWAIYFPIGIVYGLYRSRVIPWATKYKRVFIVLFLALMLLSILDRISIIRMLQASYMCSLVFVCLLPAIDRNAIPMAGRLEQIGKRSYGFYLAQFIILDLVLYMVHVLAPAIFSYPIILAVLCFVLVLFAAWGLMTQMAKPPTNRIYAYFFG